MLKKKRNKKYHRKPVYRVPLLMLNQDIPFDAIAKIDKSNRELVIKYLLHTFDNNDRKIVIKTLFTAANLSQSFEDSLDIERILTETLTKITAINFDLHDFSDSDPSGESLEESLNLAIEVFKQSSQLELLAAEALFENKKTNLLLFTKGDQL